MNAITWLIIFVVLVAVEFATMGLTTIWFAGGAILAFIAALFTNNLILQLSLFCIASLALLIFTRPLAVKWMDRGHVKTNAESMIGQNVVVTTEIDNLINSGEVQVGDITWTARTKEDGTVISKGTVVTIVEIHGVKVIVEPAIKPGSN